MYYMRPLRYMTAERFDMDIQKAIEPMPDQVKMLDRYRKYLNGENIPDIFIEFRPLFGYETDRINIDNCCEEELSKIVDKYDFNTDTIDKLSKLVDMMKKKKEKSGD